MVHRPVANTANSFTLFLFITVRKRSLRRLCFHRCLSVCPAGCPGPGRGVCPRGCQGPGPRGLSRPRPRGCPGPGPEGGCIPACTEAADGYCCGRYASYWNVFLFLFLSGLNHPRSMYNFRSTIF